MNAFDFVVTVALGSILATTLLSKDASLAQGATAFGTLIGVQFLVTWLSVRFKWIRNYIVGEPQLLFYHGRYLHHMLRVTRVTQDEILAAIRAAGCGDLASVRAVVIETDASFTVIAHADASEDSLLGVKGYDGASSHTRPCAW